MDKISIQTVPVTIRVMEVGGKRMTLAVFNQIQNGDFFDEEITDEGREQCFIGWVSHKDERYILFHINGSLKKDKYEYQRTNRKLKDNLISARRNLDYFASFKDTRPEAFRAAELEFEKAQQERKDDMDFCSKLNDGYARYFTDKAQIFIAI